MEKKTKKDRIETEVEKTLACFNEAERLETDPHFSTRLMARIRDLNSRTKTVAKPVFLYRLLRPALLVLMIAINIIFSVLMFSSGRAQTEERKDAISSMASYYDFQKNDFDSFMVYK
jgi:hypothetical protein